MMMMMMISSMQDSAVGNQRRSLPGCRKPRLVLQEPRQSSEDRKKTVSRTADKWTLVISVHFPPAGGAPACRGRQLVSSSFSKVGQKCSDGWGLDLGRRGFQLELDGPRSPRHTLTNQDATAGLVHGDTWTQSRVPAGCVVTFFNADSFSVMLHPAASPSACADQLRGDAQPQEEEETAKTERRADGSLSLRGT